LSSSEKRTPASLHTWQGNRSELGYQMVYVQTKIPNFG
jgi:hypothetical protein